MHVILAIGLCLMAACAALGLIPAVILSARAGQPRLVAYAVLVAVAAVVILSGSAEVLLS